MRKLLEPDRSLYSPQVWERLPELLEDLRSRDRILLCSCEDSDSDKTVYVGASGFLRPDFLEAAMDRGQGLLDAALLRELAGRPAFLNHKEVAEANRREDLRLLNFLGVPTWVDLIHPGASAILENLVGDPILTGVIEAWTFFHKGFRIREIWLDSAVPLMIQAYLNLGCEVPQERRLADGSVAKLLCYTQERAIGMWPGSYFAPVILCPLRALGSPELSRSCWNWRFSIARTMKPPRNCIFLPKRSRSDGGRFTPRFAGRSRPSFALTSPERISAALCSRACAITFRNSGRTDAVEPTPAG